MKTNRVIVPVNSKYTINIEIGGATPEAAAAFAANLGIGAKAHKLQWQSVSSQFVTFAYLFCIRGSISGVARSIIGPALHQLPVLEQSGAGFRTNRLFWSCTYLRCFKLTENMTAGEEGCWQGQQWPKTKLGMYHSYPFFVVRCPDGRVTYNRDPAAVG